MHELTVDGSGAEWSVFSKRTQDGKPAVVRSRLNQQELRDFASANLMARLRCIPSDGEVNGDGMPVNTAMLDEYEDTLIAQLTRSQTTAYLLAVVTGGGCRDLFFAILRREDMSGALEKIRADRPFKLQVGWLDGPKDKLIASLCP